MNHTRRALMAVAAALLTSGTVLAQASFPSKPVRVIVPYPAGGLSDFQIRAMAEPLGKLLGQPIIVDNRPGASGAIGTQAAATSAPDGHTLVFVNNGFVITPHLNKQAGYDALKNFTAVSLVTTSPMVLVVNNEIPANTVPEFIEYIKSRPAGIEYGSAGTASFGHMATALFSQATGLNMVHIPYKGEAPMTMALRTGEVKLLITTPSPSMMGAVKERQLKLLGVASSKPAPLLPGVKQISDTVPGYSAEVWFGLFAPAGTPPAHIAKLNDALAKVLAMPEIKEKYAGVGASATHSTPAAFNEITRAESARWSDLISKTGLKAE
ncbi:MAG: Bug family tripartite tricarboxylate transporter substrate binding protein [Hydrogenophaga sp.]|uniref:Bug family tripartite tricarboxylate transporter substrate binding protein n=1 Tax=Hydrogenophaga sp. TaxID=1904254 RepID=UPI003D0AEE2E